MRILFFLLITVFIFPNPISAQKDSVYTIAEVKPLLRSCMRDTTDLQREQCTNQKLLNGIYGALVYPEAAVANQTEGTVVAQFVVTDFGAVKDVQLVRDIGDGCGEAVVRVLNTMMNIEPPFRPALFEGRPVNYRYTIPVKFKIPPPPPPPLPYQVYGPDTIYSIYDSYPMYKGVEEEIQQHLADNLKYPADYVDSCSTGSMVAQIFIGKNGQLRMGEIFDYNGLGFDFQFELIQLLNATTGQWTSATYDGKKVNCVYTLRAVFSPKATACQQVATDFAAANKIAQQGEALYLEGKVDEALAAWGQAIEAFPENGEYRLQRGQVLFEAGVFDGTACEDLEIAKQHVPISGVLEGTYSIMCRKGVDEEK